MYQEEAEQRFYPAMDRRSKLRIHALQLNESASGFPRAQRQRPGAEKSRSREILGPAEPHREAPGRQLDMHLGSGV